MMEAIDSSETGTKRLKLPEDEDRISDLPDPLIQHILSFLPSTKDSIQTGILSKRWKNQWAHVPVLIFDSSMSRSYADFVRFIDNILTLYECSKMKKFHIDYDFEEDLNFDPILRFATRRDVEVLCLNYRDPWDMPGDPYILPNFIFENASLVELQIYYCYFELNYRINLPSLKVLEMHFCESGLVSTLSIENVLSGCPSLESLKLYNFRSESKGVIIASKVLKILILEAGEIEDLIEISCPNLEKLSLSNVDIVDDKTIVNVLSRSSLLHSLKLDNTYLSHLVIDSKCLTELAILFCGDSALEISCPNLDKLILYYVKIEKCKLRNLPATCCATLEFKIPSPLEEGCAKTLARKILKDLQAVNEVAVGNWFLKILSAIEMRQPSYPLLNIKCLTLVHPNFEHIVGILNAFRCSPALESLVIKFPFFEPQSTAADLDLNNSLEAYLDSNVAGFTCFESNLKTVKIVGRSNAYDKCKVVLHFVEFLLKNAKALVKMVVELQKYGGTDFLEEVSRKLLSFPRASQHAIVELL